MPRRAIIHWAFVLGRLLVAWDVPSRAGPDRTSRRWLSDLVTRIDAQDRSGRRPGSARRTGTVVIHVEIAADGTVQQIEVERGSGMPELDQRALRAVRGVSPLPAPPSTLLGLSGVADLSIPVELGR